MLNIVLVKFYITLKVLNRVLSLFRKSSDLKNKLFYKNITFIEKGKFKIKFNDDFQIISDLVYGYPFHFFPTVLIMIGGL